jgi:hypothetical protein
LEPQHATDPILLSRGWAIIAKEELQMASTNVPEKGAQARRKVDGLIGEVYAADPSKDLLTVRWSARPGLNTLVCTSEQFARDWELTGKKSSSPKEFIKTFVAVSVFVAVCCFVFVKGCGSNPASSGSSDTEARLDKIVYGTVLKIDSVQGLTPLGFKDELAEITLLEDCQVVGSFDTPPDNCPKSSDSSKVVTLSISKDKMYGPEIRVGDYIATRWSCGKSDPNSCLFVKYADAMSGSREEGIHK